MTSRLDNYASKGDSISLTKLGEKPFSIIGVEDSNYNDNGVEKEGVKITTKETFNIEGADWQKFHTGRKAIVSKLKNAKLRADIANGTVIGPVKCVPTKFKNGKGGFDLVDAS